MFWFELAQVVTQGLREFIDGVFGFGVESNDYVDIAARWRGNLLVMVFGFGLGHLIKIVVFHMTQMNGGRIALEMNVRLVRKEANCYIFTFPTNFALNYLFFSLLRLLVIHSYTYAYIFI